MANLNDHTYADLRVMARSDTVSPEMKKEVEVELCCRYISSIDDLRGELKSRNKLSQLELDALRFALDLIQKRIKTILGYE